MIRYFTTLWIFCSVASAQIHERWDVKTLGDGFKPDTANARRINVKEISLIPKVRVGNTTPRMDREKEVVRIEGTISRIQLENDGDYHIEVTDGTLGDSTADCEIPEVFAELHSYASHKKVGDPITVIGPLFQDKFHKPSKWRTRNFWEIHPGVYLK